MEAIKGTRGSICDTFSNSPKVIKDNFNIRVNTKRGNNNNVLIAYKKNLTGFESEIDTSDLVTVILPYATIQNEGEETSNDEVIQLPEKYIYSEYHKNYNNLKIIPMDFSGEDVKTVEHLRTKANNYFKNSNCDTPKVNYKVEFVPLSKTINYADYKVLETVSMCDKVIVRDHRFNLDVEAQVIKTIHCSLTQKLLSCELGNFKYSLSNVVGDINKNQEEIIDKVDKLKIDIDSEVGKLEINIKDEVNNLQSQIVQNADSITQKVSSGEIISSINQSAESVKIKANKIQLEGAVTVANKNGDSIKINNGDYEIRSNSTVKGFLGLRNLDDNYTIPRLALGQDGLLSSSNNYFVIQAYPKNNNPQNYEYPYVDIAYRLQKYKTSENVGDVSNIKMYGDGVTRLSPVKTLEITTNFKNGSYNGEGESLIAEFGSSSSSYYDKYMDIPAIRNTQTTNGLILAHRNANDQSCFVRVNCDSNGDRFFRPLTSDGNISLGSGNYQWKSVHSKTTYSSAGVVANDIEVRTVNNNDILDNINFISPLNNEEELIIDVTNIKNTNYVDSYENNVYLNNNEIIKLLLKEVKQLKEELNKFKRGKY